MSTPPPLAHPAPPEGAASAAPRPHGLPDEAGVYVHFPFCRRRCHYCDFNTYAVPEIPIERYTRAVIAELSARGAALEGRPLASVFFGGGTPGLWGAEPVRRVLEAIAQHVGPLSPTAEITIEVNPGECDEPMLRAYREVAGVNRVSFGVQSLSDRLLTNLDRLHSARQAHQALLAVRRAGFERFSADLMFGLPGQRRARWLQDLTAVLDHAPPHLSVYNLMLEPTTPLYARVRAGRVRLPSEAHQLEMMGEGWALLAERGWARYEISNFGRRGDRSVHNLLYWTGRPYLGVGAGAHALLPERASPVLGTRTSNARTYGEYMRRALEGEDVVVFREAIDADTHVRERIMTGLRLDDGVDLPEVARVTGIDPRQRYGALAAALERLGHLHVQPDRWRLTEEAIPVSDGVFARFFDA